ncbi:hypothetical protein [Bacillus solimangrovi]|uniref:hypothetical protein n=1 Tax=Bacillus solimangrovi TaxID=1305675 RepID=UPI001112D27A|nr:hypothetical protein [Bacillus solimangrovi]
MNNSWDGWELGRILILVLSIAYLLLLIQVTLSHKRGKFHRKPMWLPVITLPLLVFFGLFNSFILNDFLKWVLFTLSIIAIFTGVIGTFYHIKAIQDRTGGFNIENTMSGPPFVLPLLISLLGFANILVLFLN